MPCSSESRYIRLEVISGKNLKVPSGRIPAGIYVSINVDSKRRWKSAISVLSSDESVAWGDTLTLSSNASPALPIEIRASYELGRMLGGGEVIGKLQMSWDELLDHEDHPFDLSFRAVRGVKPSITLKVAVSLVDCEIAPDTDAGHVRVARYVRRESVSYLNDAIEHFQLVLNQCPVSHPDRATALTNLAWARLQGYIRNDVQDIDTTTSIFRDALALHPQHHPDHPLSLYNLAEALSWRHSKKSTAADICKAAQLYHELLPLCPEGTYLRGIAAGENGLDYVIGGCNNLPTDASDEGIHLRRVILELCPLGHRLRPRTLHELAGAVKAHFDQHGSIDDLDTSIQLGREAMSLCPEGHAARDAYLNNLAFSLVSRFEHQGNPNDLDEAISLYEEALHLCPVGHESRDSSLDNLGLALINRFNERSNIGDMTRAISLHREALMLCTPGHPHRDTTLHNLALALKKRYDKSQVSEDLNEAIDLYCESLRLQRLDVPDRYLTLYSLGSVLCSRFTETQKNEDIEEAIALCQESLAALSSLHPNRHFSYMRLQEAYLSRYRILHDPADLSLAVENSRLASRHSTQGFPQRIVRAFNWTVEAEQHGHGSALEAYSTFFELLDAHLATRFSATSRREAAAAFHVARTLPADAASCAICCDNLPHAVELVEQGRGQQWSLASRLRTPVEDLESANPALAHNYLELSKLVSSAAQSSATITDSAAAERAAIEYRRLTRQWEAAVAEIRDLRGFSRFLLPPLYADLQAAARQGPVIILIASQYSCSAIIVPTSGDPHHVPLPSVTLADLSNLKDRVARAIRHASTLGPKVPRNDLIVLLRTVWDEIMLPIVNVLRHDLKLKYCRIWLCPTAAFTSIPLHAAHPFRTNPDGSREQCLEDLYICSYTPTLSALVRSRQTMKKRVTPSFVTIGQGQPGAGKGKALLAVDSELELVHKLVPVTARHTSVSGDAATRAGALEALQQNTWVHLACHGKQDPEQPYNSHFVMRDEDLTLLDIMERDIPHAEFAFLSACHTAVGDEETPDEIIHLAAGLQFSGFKSVIGTLWQVDDSVAKHVVKAFYESMFKDLKDGGAMDCTKAAWALNRATHAVKTQVPLEQRMVFVHIVIGGKNLHVPSWRIPAGIYVFINVDSRRRWKSAINVLSSDKSVAWGNTVTLPSNASPALSIEIRASYELGRMLGGGEVIGELQVSWDELLDHGDHPFDLSFPAVRDVQPSITLKVAVVHACDDQKGALFDSLVDCEIARDADAGHAQFASYRENENVNVSHLNDAMEHFQLVLNQCPVGHPDRAAALTNLAWVRLKGYIRNHIQDIDTTTSLFRDALALRPQHHPDHPLSLYNLTEALGWRHSKKSTAADICEAAQLYYELLPLCPEGTYLRSIAAGENGLDYVIGGCNSLPTDASDEGIQLRRVVLELCPRSHRLRPRTLDELAQAVKARFDQHGSIDDLDTSIQLRREAVSLCPEGHADRDTYLNSLAFSLVPRFKHQGNTNDLHEAIYLYEEALHLRPVGHESRDCSLGNLGGALVDRFNERGDIDDMTRAISLYREALTLCLPGHSYHDTTLNNFALALQNRYDKSQVSEDLNEAIDQYRDCLRLKRLDNPERHKTLFNLSSALCSRFTQTQETEDVEEAIALLENSRLASRHSTQGFPERIISAFNWTVAAERHSHGSALEAYSTFFELLDTHLATRFSATSRREAAAAFHYARTLPADAASCAIRCDNLPHAVELVEQGRGQQWSLASRLRTPVEALESANPALAHNYLELSKLVSSAAQSSATITHNAAVDRAAIEYRRLTRQWEAAVAEIRDLRGFSRFLLPPLYADLQAAARQGPVIILIASEYLCSAIIVPTSGHPHHVSLPSVTLADLSNLKDRVTMAIRHASTLGPKVPRNDLIVLLRTVWDEIMLPIVNVLRHDLKLKYCRIWLCPTAAFTSIPLHAAHPFRTNPDGSREPCLEDLYICSYTPTLSALVRSRQMMKTRVTPSFVTIGQGQPGAGKGKALLAVESELELVHKLVPATAKRTTISGDAATRAGALEALQQNTWVHLACHGKQDPKQPYNSHFVMRDEDLTLLNIMERDIPHAEFAFLSACHTAVGDEETPDEVIHLAAGLQFSGFKSVIGTLWQVDDAVAKHVVKAFYENMFSDLKDGGVLDCTKAAWALNRATHAVKTQVPLEQRMVFVHIGV
ncbi:CHAT domain-containing protein [Suillus plorans]|uniref:CHAT domain-containing protein n=1 Tax=Suillus plorans TaxID=116603 RepID=A0A9P7DE02_9AGAM|nr:CHAT domain-containing protein [Suillus plorans]KAG1788963.1 CHAT domain-containing protein [Suillus plorans]